MMTPRLKSSVRHVNLNDVTGNDKFRTHDLISSEGVYSVNPISANQGDERVVKVLI